MCGNENQPRFASVTLGWPMSSGGGDKVRCRWNPGAAVPQVGFEPNVQNAAKGRRSTIRAQRTYETSIHIATAANTVPNNKLSFRELSGDLKKLAIRSPTNVQIKKAIRLLSVKTVVIRMTEAKLLMPVGLKNCVNIKAIMT